MALFGPGGVGKTSVAVEYAHRRLAECGVAWQLPVDEPVALSGGLSELVAQLDSGASRDASTPVARLHAALARRNDWLLIFDNVPGPAEIEGLLPPTGGGQVLITSQYSNWPSGRVLEVPELAQATAAEFLMTRTGASGDEEAAAAELADELGGLPLALEQAAAYMGTTGRDIRGLPGPVPGLGAESSWPAATYRVRQAGHHDLGAGLRRNRPVRPGVRAASAGGLLRGGEHPPAPAAAPPARTRHCRRRGGGAAADAATRGPLACDDAIAALRRYSLISAPRGGMVSAHRLVQGSLRRSWARGWRRTGGGPPRR